MPNPEELARINIDKQLTACGWTIQGMSGLNRYAGLGVAVREFPLATGEADYLLFVDGKAIGVVDATVEAALVRASRLRQAVLKCAFEGGLG